LQVPLTLDRETVKVLLLEAFIGLAGEKTAIGDAITLAVKRIHDQGADADEQVLILLTDGANTAGEIDPIKAAELAQQIGLRIYTIGIGAEQMVVSSITGGMRRVNPSADLDEATLRSRIPSGQVALLLAAGWCVPAGHVPGRHDVADRTRTLARTQGEIECGLSFTSCDRNGCGRCRSSH
jgi:hypothetical protein